MLSPIIEYLLAQTRPGERGSLCFPSRWQFVIPIIPPGTVINFSMGPPYGTFAAIKYAATLTQEHVPGTLYMEITQAGLRYAVGDINLDWERDYLAYFVVFTEADPITMQLTNNSPLNQQFVSTTWTVLIPSEADFHLVREHIAAYSSIVGNELSQQANQLLRQLVTLSGGIPVTEEKYHL